MTEMKIVAHIQRIEPKLHHDVTWGTALKNNKNPSIGFAIEINPSNNHIAPYKMVAMIPDLNYADGGIGILRVVLSLFLDSGDIYKATKSNLDVLSKFASENAAFICFDPETLTDFYWLIPPQHEKN